MVAGPTSPRPRATLTDEMTIQPDVFRANRAEPGDGGWVSPANAAGTRVTRPVWKTRPQRG